MNISITPIQISNNPESTVEYLLIKVLVNKEPKWLPTPIVISENKPIDITVHIAEIPLAPIPIPPARQFADRANPSGIDSLTEIIRFISLSIVSGFFKQS